MKKVITTFFVALTVGAFAQDISTYGLVANPVQLSQNASIDPLTKFHLSYVGFNQQLGFSHTAGEIFSSTDLLGNIASFDKPFSVQQSIDVQALNFGFKLGNSYLFYDNNVNTSLSAKLDPDFFHFLKYGVGDVNGNILPSYAGDFSDFGITLSVVARNGVGFQTTLEEQRLRLGVKLNAYSIVGGTKLHTNDFALDNTVDPVTGISSLDLSYDLEMLTDLNDPNVSVNSLSDLDSSFRAGLALLVDDPTAKLLQGKNNYTLDLAATMKVTSNFELSFSYAGLGAKNIVKSMTRYSASASLEDINGFSYSSTAGDSIGTAISTAVDEFQTTLTDNLGGTFNSGTGDFTYQIPRYINAHARYYIGKRTNLTVHYTRKSNAALPYELLGVNGNLFLYKGIQLRGGYYYNIMNPANFRTVAGLQFRLSPMFQVYLSSSYVGDIATIATASDFSTANGVVVGTATDGLQYTFGLNAVLFDKRFKEEKAARQLKRAEKKRIKREKNPAKSNPQQ